MRSARTRPNTQHAHANVRHEITCIIPAALSFGLRGFSQHRAQIHGGVLPFFHYLITVIPVLAAVSYRLDKHAIKKGDPPEFPAGSARSPKPCIALRSPTSPDPTSFSPPPKRPYHPPWLPSPPIFPIRVLVTVAAAAIRWAVFSSNPNPISKTMAPHRSLDPESRDLAVGQAHPSRTPTLDQSLCYHFMTIVGRLPRTQLQGGE